MSIIIQKYGGTSVGSIERMRHVAELVISEKKQGNQVVVVVSAMVGVTNALAKQASEFHPTHNSMARDFVISSGENISSGLLALAIQERGVEGVPLSGWQVPIITTPIHGKASIQQTDPVRLSMLLAQGSIPVISGFQGVSEAGMITTLGRGGSDTSAVALAAALNAERCDIYTDIDGVYTADPRLVSEAKLIQNLSYDFAILMAHQGAKVVHPAAMEMAKSARVPIRVLSSFGSDCFTSIGAADDFDVCAVSHIENLAVFSTQVNNGFSEALETIKRNNVVVDVIDLKADRVVGCVLEEDIAFVSEELNARKIFPKWQKAAKVSWVDSGAESRAQRILNLISDGDFPILNLWKCPGRVSATIPRDHLRSFVSYLHQYIF